MLKNKVAYEFLTTMKIPYKIEQCCNNGKVTL